MRTTRKIRRAARRLFRFCVVEGSLRDQRVRRVARRLTMRGGRTSLGTLVELRRLVRLDRERHRAVVESASLLPPEVLADVRSTLTARYGPGLKISFELDPRLIGGMRVRVGSDVYDGTVRGRLAALEARW